MARGVLYFFFLGLIVLGPWERRGTSLGPAQAVATAAVLRVLGIDATHSGDTVEGEKFSMRVAPVCDGLDFALILSLAILVSPATWTARLLGVVLAAVASQVLNLVRLVCMFAIGAYFPARFELAHHLVWQVVAIVVAVGVYATWIDRVTTANGA